MLDFCSALLDQCLTSDDGRSMELREDFPELAHGKIEDIFARSNHFRRNEAFAHLQENATYKVHAAGVDPEVVILREDDCLLRRREEELELIPHQLGIACDSTTGL